MPVEFYRHPLTAEDSRKVADVLATPFLTSGDVGRGVEAQLRAFFEAPHALLLNSWTNGAHAALLALGIGPGDEVVVPAMTFIATANVVEHVGATPVFVDVDPDTLLVTPALVSAAVTARTRAVIPVHLYGQMVDMAGLRRALAHRLDIALIEDCAHAFEAERDGDRPGAHSDVAIFSFYATKNVTCGEGGAIVTRDAALYDKLVQTRRHGMTADAVDRYRDGRYRHWDMVRLGVKANLPDLLAALLPDQIGSIRERLPVRRALAERYRQAFWNTPIRLVQDAPAVVHAHHLYPIHVPPPVRDKAIAALNARGIGVTVNYRAVPRMSYYRGRFGDLDRSVPVSTLWGEGTISLPLYPGLTRAEQDEVIAAVRERVVPLVLEAPEARNPG